MTMKITKLCSACAFVLALSSSSVAVASGIPTVDVGAILKMNEQIQEMQRQYEMLAQQYEEAQRLTSKFEGVSGIGQAIHTDVLTKLFPQLADYLEDLTFENMPSGAQDIFTARGYDKACKTDSFVYDECMENYVYLASSQYAYEESARNARKYGEDLNKLKVEIQNAQTQKEISDLQARLLAESGQIQLSQLKADQLARSIQAARENAKRASAEKIKKSFWGDKY